MAAKRILVVDDEVKIRGMYRRLFYSAGYEVMASGSAIDAYDLLLQNKFDIVLLDINMPAVDGTSLYEVIRASHKNIKVIVSSVYSINEQKVRIKDADGYFDKSDSKEDLFSIITSFDSSPAKIIGII